MIVKQGRRWVFLLLDAGGAEWITPTVDGLWGEGDTIEEAIAETHGRVRRFATLKAATEAEAAERWRLYTRTME